MSDLLRERVRMLVRRIDDTGVRGQLGGTIVREVCEALGESEFDVLHPPEEPDEEAPEPEPEPEPESFDARVSRAALEVLTNDALRDMLRERDLPISGTKAELIDRLLEV